MDSLKLLLVPPVYFEKSIPWRLAFCTCTTFGKVWKKANMIRVSPQCHKHTSKWIASACSLTTTTTLVRKEGRNIPTRWITIGRESGGRCSGWQIVWFKCWSLPLCIENNTFRTFYHSGKSSAKCWPAHAIWIICLAAPGSVEMAHIAWVVWKKTFKEF